MMNTRFQTVEIKRQASKKVESGWLQVPVYPYSSLPCRLDTEDATIIWGADGYVTKTIIDSGDKYTWVPLPLLPINDEWHKTRADGSGYTRLRYGMGKIKWSAEIKVAQEEGMLVPWFTDEYGIGGWDLFWKDYEVNRCKTLGFHVGAGDCTICTPLE